MHVAIRFRGLVFLLAFVTTAPFFDSRAAALTAPNEGGYDLFAQTNLMAWCIVPFDSKKRGPEERAEMLQRLHFGQFVYDYRVEHIPQFDAEIEALKQREIRLAGWWFPTSLNDEAKSTLELFKKHQIHPQLWVMGGGGPARNPEEQRARIETEAKRIAEIAAAGAKIGSTVGLYNHGGWFGEPENQIAIIEQLRRQNITNVGIIYNQHHGHGDIPHFSELLRKMKPYLLALNINGMDENGETNGRQILPVGQGVLDLTLLKTIQKSGWHGPIGILCHAQVDAERRLRDNLEGLAWLRAQLKGEMPGPKPKPLSWPE